MADFITLHNVMVSTFKLLFYRRQGRATVQPGMPKCLHVHVVRLFDNRKSSQHNKKNRGNERFYLNWHVHIYFNFVYISIADSSFFFLLKSTANVDKRHWSKYGNLRCLVDLICWGARILKNFVREIFRAFHISIRNMFNLIFSRTLKRFPSNSLTLHYFSLNSFQFVHSSIYEKQ